jgi:hypothetical protein
MLARPSSLLALAALRGQLLTEGNEPTARAAARGRPPA